MTMRKKASPHPAARNDSYPAYHMKIAFNSPARKRLTVAIAVVLSLALRRALPPRSLLAPGWEARPTEPACKRRRGSIPATPNIAITSAATTIWWLAIPSAAIGTTMKLRCNSIRTPPATGLIWPAPIRFSGDIAQSRLLPWSTPSRPIA